jgi:hypothetical protein
MRVCEEIGGNIEFDSFDVAKNFTAKLETCEIALRGFATKDK